MRRGYLVALWLIPIFLGLFFRLNKIDNISFSYDQARDAFSAQEIIHGNLKIIGPPTDLQVVFHGPFYYYVLSIIYFFSRDPRFAVICFTVINLISLVPLSILVNKLFNSKLVTWFFVLLFAVSPEMIFYGRFISNVSLVIPTISVGLLGLWFMPRTKSILLAAIGLGLAAQAEFFLLSLFPLALIYLFLKKTGLKAIFRFAATYLIVISPYIVSELKFSFRGFSRFLEFSTHQSVAIIEILNRIAGSYVGLLERNIFHFPSWLSLILLGTIVFFLYKRTDRKTSSFLLFFSLTTLPLFIYASPGPIFFTIGIVLPILILIASTVKTIPLLGIVVILFSLVRNLPYVARGIESNSTFTGSETGMILGDELSIIDSVYSHHGKLSYNSVTAPLFTNTTWAYLFDWYGKSRYGFVPDWHGNDQTGMPGGEFHQLSDGNEDIDFLIVETSRVPIEYQKKLINIETFRAKPQKRISFGQIDLIIGSRIK